MLRYQVKSHVYQKNNKLSCMTSLSLSLSIGIPEPVAIATFLVKAARPTHIVLSHFDEDGRPLAMLPGFVVLPSSSSQNDIDMVKLRGWLADR